MCGRGWLCGDLVSLRPQDSTTACGSEAGASRLSVFVRLKPHFPGLKPGAPSFPPFADGFGDNESCIVVDCILEARNGDVLD